MVYDFTCLFVESEEQNKAKQKQIHRYRKQTASCQRGERKKMGGWTKQVNRSRGTIFPL